MHTYLLWLGIFVATPLAILWLTHFATLKRYFAVYVITLVGSLLVAVPWDLIAIHEQIWYFTEPHIIGQWFMGLPIEEWFFIVLVALLFATLTVLMKKIYVR